MTNEACALLDLRLSSDEMLEAANRLEDHHETLQKIAGRKADPGDWNISVVAEADYIGVSAFGPWGWSLLSVNDHVYVCGGGAWENVEADRGAGKVFRDTVASIAELLSVPAWALMTEDARDRLEAWASGQDGADFALRLDRLRSGEEDEMPFLALPETS